MQKLEHGAEGHITFGSIMKSTPQIEAAACAGFIYPKDSDFKNIGKQYRTDRGYKPDAFVNKREGKARKALEQKGIIFLEEEFGDNLTHYVIHSDELGLSDEHGEPDGFFDRNLVNGWKQRAKEMFPYHHGRLEIGQHPKHQQRTHLHLIAPSKTEAKGFKRMLELEELPMLLEYLRKPQLPVTDEFIGRYVYERVKQRQQRSRLPRTTWTFFPRKPSREPAVTVPMSMSYVLSSHNHLKA